MTKTMKAEEARGLLSQAKQKAAKGDWFEALVLTAKVLRAENIDSAELNKEAFEQGSLYMKELVSDGWVVTGVDPEDQSVTWAKGPIAFA